MKGKKKVKFRVRIPSTRTGGICEDFACEAWEGQSLRDFVSDGTGQHAGTLASYLECACSGIMVPSCTNNIFAIIKLFFFLHG